MNMIKLQNTCPNFGSNSFWGQNEYVTKWMVPTWTKPLICSIYDVFKAHWSWNQHLKPPYKSQNCWFISFCVHASWFSWLNPTKTIHTMWKWTGKLSDWGHLKCPINCLICLCNNMRVRKILICHIRQQWVPRFLWWSSPTHQIISLSCATQTDFDFMRAFTIIPKTPDFSGFDIRVVRLKGHTVGRKPMRGISHPLIWLLLT